MRCEGSEFTDARETGNSMEIDRGSFINDLKKRFREEKIFAKNF